MTTTIFSWGYFGWGSHTRDLIAAVDAVEKSRGFEPPIFVDIRVHRSVRAIGFNAANFEKLLGDGRHRWMKSLGNARVSSGEGPLIQIVQPSSARELLDFALSKAKENRRVIYFCGCDFPRYDGEINCHRTAVTELLLNEARNEQTSIQVVEWPGGEPRRIRLDLSPSDFTAVRKGKRTIPLVGGEPTPEMLGLPWCSVATLHCLSDSIRRIVGPAIRKQGQWCLRVLSTRLEPGKGGTQYEKRAGKLRRELGLNPAEQQLLNDVPRKGK